MNPTWKRRFVEWICEVFGHRKEFTHTYAGKKHYSCKRCGGIISKPLNWQEKIILEQIEELEE